jgi:hypothetical protein
MWERKCSFHDPRVAIAIPLSRACTADCRPATKKTVRVLIFRECPYSSIQGMDCKPLIGFYTFLARFFPQGSAIRKSIAIGRGAMEFCREAHAI